MFYKGDKIRRLSNFYRFCVSKIDVVICLFHDKSKRFTIIKLYCNFATLIHSLAMLYCFIPKFLYPGMKKLRWGYIIFWSHLLSLRPGLQGSLNVERTSAFQFILNRNSVRQCTILSAYKLLVGLNKFKLRPCAHDFKPSADWVFELIIFYCLCLHWFFFHFCFVQFVQNHRAETIAATCHMQRRNNATLGCWLNPGHAIGVAVKCCFSQLLPIALFTRGKTRDIF